jgi:hypothetical protein
MKRINTVICICFLILCLSAFEQKAFAQPGQPNASGSVDDLVPPNSAQRAEGDVGWNTDCTMTNNEPALVLRMRVKIFLAKYNVSTNQWDQIDSHQTTALVDHGQTVQLLDVGKTTNLVGDESYLVYSQVWAEYVQTDPEIPPPGLPVLLDDLSHIFVVDE